MLISCFTVKRCVVLLYSNWLFHYFTIGYFSASSVESLTEMEDDDDDDCVPGTPTPEDFSHHFSYPNSPSEPSPLSNGLPPCHILTYADVVSGKLYHCD